MADKKIVGIDLTSREIRMVQLSGGRTGTTLEKFAIGPIPPGAVQGGRIADPNKLSEAIRDLLKGNRFSAKKCILGISGKYGVTRMISLPKMSMAQTRDAIMLQLNQYVPFPPHDALYDFKLMRELKEEGGVQNEILLAATRRSSIQPFINLLKRAGLTVVGIKLTTLASFSLFDDHYRDSEQAVAFIDVRDNVTDIFFVAENNFRLARSVEFGFNIIMDKARQKLGKTAEETREHLFLNKVDLMASYRGAEDEEEAKKKVYDEDLKDIRLSDDHIDANQIFEGEEKESPEKLARDSVLRAMSSFVNELMRSVRYFESQQKRRSRVGKMICFGNIGMLESLDEYLAEQTGYDVLVSERIPANVSVALDPTELNALRDHEGEIITALGLALESLRSKKLELNLLPRETMVRRKAYSGLKFGIIGLVALVVVLAVLYVQKNQQFVEVKSEVDILTGYIAKVEPAYNETKDVQSDISGIKPKLGGLVTLSGAQVPWPVIMDEVGRVMNDNIWIDKFGFDANGGSFEIEGFAFTTMELQMFLVRMFDSQVFVNIKLDKKDIESGGAEGADPDQFVPQRRGTIGGMRRSATAPNSATPGLREEWNKYSPGISNLDNKPEPMYKLPDGPSYWRTIEDYFAGTMWFPPLLYNFEISGDINPEILKVGNQVFGPEVVGFFGS